MDLPTCPSCGQSVLDDEPTVCPFCGAAMDGSSAPTKKPQTASRPRKKKPAAGAAGKAAKSSTAAAKKKAVTSVKPAAGGKDDDPFDIAASPQALRAIACSPKRTKSRSMKVTCPMCDKVGYVPPSAAGKQVKCCSKDCMVPLFTAPEPSRAKTAGTPERISDQAAQQEERLAAPPKKRSPMVMYGVLGGVLLIAGIGLKFYLDSAPDDEKFNRPFDNPILPVADEDDESGSSESETVSTADEEAAHVTIRRLADQMVLSAQASVNRDKALCRRMTADAFLKLGDEERAAAELGQLVRVSHQRNRLDDYYRITPCSRSYFDAVRRGDQASAESLLTRMQTDAKTIPTYGLLAVDAAISWGAVLVHQDQASAARELVGRLDVDSTVRTKMDALHRGVWTSGMMSAASDGRHSDSPIVCLTMQEPVAVAIARELALQQQWESALAWAAIWPDEMVQSDLLAAIARQAIRLQASPEVIEVLASAGATEVARQRLQAVLAGQSDERWQQASALLPSEEVSAKTMPSVSSLIRYRTPALQAARRSAYLLTELARSAALRGDTEATTSVLLKLADTLMKDLPPTSAVRQASGELDQSEKDVHRKIRSALGRSSTADVSSQFRSYRRGLDRLAAAVEQRRLLLVCLLCSVVEVDGGTALNQALDQSEALADELTLDPLCHLISAEAILAGGHVPQLEAVNTVRIPRGRRTPEQLEEEIAVVWFDTVRGVGPNHDDRILDPLQSTTELPGLRSCLQSRLVEALAVRSDVAVLDAIANVTSEVARETSLWTAGLWLVRAGKQDAVESWASNSRLSATDRVMTISGMINGMEVTAPDSESETP